MFDTNQDLNKFNGMAFQAKLNEKYTTASLKNGISGNESSGRS
jgi:hypothetical protein